MKIPTDFDREQRDIHMRQQRQQQQQPEQDKFSRQKKPHVSNYHFRGFENDNFSSLSAVNNNNNGTGAVRPFPQQYGTRSNGRKDLMDNNNNMIYERTDYEEHSIGYGPLVTNDKLPRGGINNNNYRQVRPKSVATEKPRNRYMASSTSRQPQQAHLRNGNPNQRAFDTNDILPNYFGDDDGGFKDRGGEDYYVSGNERSGRKPARYEDGPLLTSTPRDRRIQPDDIQRQQRTITHENRYPPTMMPPIQEMVDRRGDPYDIQQQQQERPGTTSVVSQRSRSSPMHKNYGVGSYRLYDGNYPNPTPQPPPQGGFIPPPQLQQHQTSQLTSEPDDVYWLQREPLLPIDLANQGYFSTRRKNQQQPGSSDIRLLTNDTFNRPQEGTNLFPQPNYYVPPPPATDSSFAQTGESGGIVPYPVPESQGIYGLSYGAGASTKKEEKKRSGGLCKSSAAKKAEKKRAQSSPQRDLVYGPGPISVPVIPQTVVPYPVNPMTPLPSAGINVPTGQSSDTAAQNIQTVTFNNPGPTSPPSTNVSGIPTKIRKIPSPQRTFYAFQKMKEGISQYVSYLKVRINEMITQYERTPFSPMQFPPDRSVLKSGTFSDAKDKKTSSKKKELLESKITSGSKTVGSKTVSPGYFSQDIDPNEPAGYGYQSQNPLLMEKKIKNAQRLVKHLEYHVTKIDRLYDDYLQAFKLRDGTRTMSFAATDPKNPKSSARVVKDSLHQLELERKDCDRTMCYIENCLQTLMGTFHFVIKEISGYARIGAGDQFQIDLKYAYPKFKKFIARCRVDRKLYQHWDKRGRAYPLLLHETMGLKAKELKTLGSSLLMKTTLDPLDLISIIPILKYVRLTPNGSLKLNALFFWNPLGNEQAEELDFLYENSSFYDNFITSKTPSEFVVSHLPPLMLGGQKSSPPSPDSGIFSPQPLLHGPGSALGGNNNNYYAYGRLPVDERGEQQLYGGSYRNPDTRFNPQNDSGYGNVRERSRETERYGTRDSSYSSLERDYNQNERPLSKQHYRHPMNIDSDDGLMQNNNRNDNGNNSTNRSIFVGGDRSRAHSYDPYHGRETYQPYMYENFSGPPALNYDSGAFFENSTNSLNRDSLQNNPGNFQQNSGKDEPFYSLDRNGTTTSSPRVIPILMSSRFRHRVEKNPSSDIGFKSAQDYYGQQNSSFNNNNNHNDDSQNFDDNQVKQSFDQYYMNGNVKRNNQVSPRNDTEIIDLRKPFNDVMYELKQCSQVSQGITTGTSGIGDKSIKNGKNYTPELNDLNEIVKQFYEYLTYFNNTDEVGEKTIDRIRMDRGDPQSTKDGSAFAAGTQNYGYSPSNVTGTQLGHNDKILGGDNPTPGKKKHENIISTALRSFDFLSKDDKRGLPSSAGGYKTPTKSSLIYENPGNRSFENVKISPLAIDSGLDSTHGSSLDRTSSLPINNKPISTENLALDKCLRIHLAQTSLALRSLKNILGQQNNSSLNASNEANYDSELPGLKLSLIKCLKVLKVQSLCLEVYFEIATHSAARDINVILAILNKYTNLNGWGNVNKIMSFWSKAVSANDETGSPNHQVLLVSSRIFEGQLEREYLPYLLQSHTQQIISLVFPKAISEIQRIITDPYIPNWNETSLTERNEMDSLGVGNYVTLLQLVFYLKINGITDYRNTLNELAKELEFRDLFTAGNQNGLIRYILSLNRSLPPANSFDMICRLLCNNDEINRFTVSYLHGLANNPETRKRAIYKALACLESNDITIRCGACRALQNLKATEAISQLLDTFTLDPNIKVNECARIALLNLGPAGIQAYERLIGHNNILPNEDNNKGVSSPISNDYEQRNFTNPPNNDGGYTNKLVNDFIDNNNESRHLTKQPISSLSTSVGGPGRYYSYKPDLQL